MGEVHRCVVQADEYRQNREEGRNHKAIVVKTLLTLLIATCDTPLRIYLLLLSRKDMRIEIHFALESI